MHPRHSLYKIFNEYGDRATILNYGARVVSLDINVNQNLRNIILGYSEMYDYINDSYYMGATIGRYSNRIKNSCYEKDGKKFVLSPNEGENQLHGGPLGFDRLIWSEHSKSDSHICLEYFSTHNDQGFPGNMSARISYAWESDRTLRIDFSASSDRETPVSLTNHNYYNLNGHQSSIKNHTIQLDASEITSIHHDFTATGDFESVINSCLDLNHEKSISDLINGEDPMLKHAGGLDFNYVLRKGSVVSVTNELKDLILELRTNYPGIQIYTGQHLDKPFQRYQGLCLEPQFYPCSPNHPHFPDCFIGPDKILNKFIKLRFKEGDLL